MFVMVPEAGIIEAFIVDTIIYMGKPCFSSKQVQPVSRTFSQRCFFDVLMWGCAGFVDLHIFTGVTVALPLAEICHCHFAFSLLTGIFERFCIFIYRVS